MAKKPVEPIPELSAVVSAYARLDDALPPASRTRYYWQYRLDGWPTTLHYEFLATRGGAKIGVELHLESAGAAALFPLLEDLRDPVADAIPGVATRVDLAWQKVGARLTTEFPRAADPQQVAEAMATLVRLTRDAVSEAHSRIGAKTAATVVHTDDGRPLDARFHVEPDTGRLAVVFLASSGDKASKSPNHDYVEGLGLVVQRIASLRGRLIDAFVDSPEARRLPPGERRLLADSRALPAELAALDDLSAFTAELSRLQRDTASASAPGHGKSTQRIRLLVDVPGVTRPSELADHLAWPWRLACSVAEVLSNIRKFEAAPAELQASVKLGSNFAFDPRSDGLAPSKFAGIFKMSFERYSLPTSDHPRIFHGTRTKAVLERLSSSSNSPESLDALRRCCERVGAALPSSPSVFVITCEPEVPVSPFDRLCGELREANLTFSDETVSNFVLALQAKRFVILTGISGTGKTQIALALANRVSKSAAADRVAQEPHEEPSDRVVVAVRPDWTDRRGLLGYYNPLVQAYSAPPFLRLLFRARDEFLDAGLQERPARPFFGVLDEMNLARVEHYFSDFLSCLESGEPLELHSEETRTADGLTIPAKLRIPPNLLFIGTVNIDETTYMFSSKVLDRAFSLEFNQVCLGPESAQESAFRLEDWDGSLLTSGPVGGPHARCWKPTSRDWEELGRIARPERDRILALHAILEKDHQHFGYRVANEIARYLLLARGQTRGGLGVALDLAILQKVLPKLHGTQQEIGALVDSLLCWTIDPDQAEQVRVQDWEPQGRVVAHAPSRTLDAAPGPAERYATVVPSPSRTPAYPRSAFKLARMRQRLLKRGFAAWVE